MSSVAQKVHGVAICHAHDGREIATRVRVALEDRSISCWTPPEDDDGSACLSPDTDAIDASWIALFVLSSGAMADATLVRAVGYAVAHSRWIFTLRVDRAAVPKTLEYYVGDLRAFDVGTTTLDLSLERLADDAESILESLRA